MLSIKQAMENPELMIKYKDRFKNVEIFLHPWYVVFRKHPYLYREFSDRFDEMDGSDIACALRDDPTLVLDLRDYLHKIGGEDIKWLSWNCPEMSLCMEYRGDLDKVEAAYYITFPRKLDDLNNKEKRKILKKTLGLLRGEKV